MAAGLDREKILARHPCAIPATLAERRYNFRMQSVPILGTRVAAVTRGEAATQALAWAKAGDRAYAVEAADVHAVTRGRHDAAFGEALGCFDMVCPDGMPLVWAINSRVPAARRLRERVSGAELMGALFEASQADRGLGHFLLGGSPDLLEELGGKLAARFPAARIAGVYSPPFGAWPADEFGRICGMISGSGANLVWVALGCPKQEQWIGNHKDRLPPAVYFGIGAAFAFHAGRVARAPAWCQRIGLEWAYRIWREPRRLFRRYFVHNSLFVYYRLREWLGGGRRPGPA